MKTFALVFDRKYLDSPIVQDSIRFEYPRLNVSQKLLVTDSGAFELGLGSRRVPAQAVSVVNRVIERIERRTLNLRDVLALCDNADGDWRVSVFLFDARASLLRTNLKGLFKFVEEFPLRVSEFESQAFEWSSTSTVPVTSLHEPELLSSIGAFVLVPAWFNNEWHLLFQIRRDQARQKMLHGLDRVSPVLFGDYPGGTVQLSDESFNAAALREFKEETDCRVEHLRAFGVYSARVGKRWDHAHAFLGRMIGAPQPSPEAEGFLYLAREQFLVPSEYRCAGTTGRLQQMALDFFSRIDTLDLAAYR